MARRKPSALGIQFAKIKSDQIARLPKDSARVKSAEGRLAKNKAAKAKKAKSGSASALADSMIKARGKYR